MNINFQENCLIQITAEEHNDSGYIVQPDFPLAAIPAETTAANVATPAAPVLDDPATNKRGGVVLNWTNSSKFNPSTYTVQIYRTAADPHGNDRTNSVLVGTSKGTQFTDPIVEAGANTFYYWIRYAVNVPQQRTSGVAPREIFSAYHPVSSTAGKSSTAAGTIDGMMISDVNDNARVFADPNAGSLDGGGERIELRLPITIEKFQRDAPGYPRYYAVLDSLDYDDESPWPVEADGQGYSLVRKETNGPSYQASDWELSANRGGSAFGGGVVLVNEILSHTDLPQTDVIELYNPGTEDVNIGGWYLTDDPINPKKYVIPSNTIVPAGGYWAVNEDNNAAPGAPLNYFGTSFSLSSRGDFVYLFSGDSQNRLTGYSHGTEFRATQNGVSIIRYINGAGNEIFVPQSG